MLGAKKELNTELNLSSFIDLLSTLVCFLLVSAVWVQVASLDVMQSHGTDSGAPSEAAALDIDFVDAGKANLILKKGGRVIQKTVVQQTEIKALVEKINLAVISFKQMPALKNARIESVLIGTHPKLIHGDMISVMDGLRMHQITNIGVKPAGGK